MDNDPLDDGGEPSLPGGLSIYNEELWFTNLVLEKSVRIDTSDYQSGSVTNYVGGGHSGFVAGDGKQAPSQYQYVQLTDGNLLIVWAKDVGKILVMAAGPVLRQSIVISTCFIDCLIRQISHFLLTRFVSQTQPSMNTSQTSGKLKPGRLAKQHLTISSFTRSIRTEIS